MPGYTGVEISKLCRDVRPDFPVILCTGFSETIDLAKANKLGLGFVNKPVDTNKFLRMVGDFVNIDQS